MVPQHKPCTGPKTRAHHTDQCEDIQSWLSWTAPERLNAQPRNRGTVDHHPAATKHDIKWTMDTSCQQKQPQCNEC